MRFFTFVTIVTRMAMISSVLDQKFKPVGCFVYMRTIFKANSVVRSRRSFLVSLIAFSSEFIIQIS